MTPVDRMSLRVAMDGASKNAGYAIVTMTVVMAVMKRTARQRRARQRSLRARKAFASPISGAATASLIVRMAAMSG